MAQPLFKQAGGKRALTEELLAWFPSTFDTFAEPFFGGGAVFFEAQEHGILNDKLVLLGDVDRWLIRLLIDVRAFPARVHRKLIALGEEMDASGDPREYYRTIRSLWNLGDRKPEYLLFLRSCAYNGLWRTNKAGEFNADWNKECPPKLPALERLEDAAQALAGAELLAWNFRQWEPADDPRAPDSEREAAEAAHASGDGSVWIGPGTVVYLDPPYLGGWAGYQPGGFTAQDQEDVVRLAALWSRRGARVIYSQADAPEARQLLSTFWPEATIDQHMMKRTINADGDGRGAVPEIIAAA